MGYFGKIARDTALFAAVGAVLALAAPVLAYAFDIGGYNGHIGTLGDALWTGVFFGAFGGIHAALAPLLDKAIGVVAPEKEESKARAQEPAVERAPAVPIPTMDLKVNHVERLEARDLSAVVTGRSAY